MRDVDFAESEFPGRQEAWLKESVPLGDVIDMDDQDAEEESESEEGAVGGDLKAGESDGDIDEEYRSFTEEADDTPTASDPVSTVDEGSRPRRTRNVPAWHSDYDVEYAAYALNAASFVEDLPTSLEDARKRSDWTKWEAAVNEEMDALEKNETWSLVELPPNRKPISSK